MLVFGGRLRKGSEFVEEWMEKHCRIVYVSMRDDGDGSNMHGTLSGFTKYISEQFGGGPGTVCFA